MFTAGEHPQHSSRVSMVTGLFQYLLVSDDNRIRAEHVATGKALRNSVGFLFRQSQSVSQRRLSVSALFVDVGGINFKPNAGFAQ
jgi:hypothetical protein